MSLSPELDSLNFLLGEYDCYVSLSDKLLRCIDVPAALSIQVNKSYKLLNIPPFLISLQAQYKMLIITDCFSAKTICMDKVKMA